MHEYKFPGFEKLYLTSYFLDRQPGPKINAFLTKYEHFQVQT